MNRKRQQQQLTLRIFSSLFFFELSAQQQNHVRLKQVHCIPKTSAQYDKQFQFMPVHFRWSVAVNSVIEQIV